MVKIEDRYKPILDSPILNLENKRGCVHVLANQKTIVTHVSPDLDGIPAIWLLKKFHPDFANAKLAFVPAGSTLNNEKVDSNPDIVHVDTGLGMFDHHSNDDFTCGAQLVYEWLVREGYIDEKDEAMKRLITVLTELDHGWDNWKWSDADSDRNEFMLHNILFGWKMVKPKEEEKYVEWVSFAMDAVYAVFRSKVRADEELAKGKKFESKWGQGIAVESGNSTVLDLAIKKGYAVVVTKDPKKGNVRVTGSNAKEVDLTKAYEAVKSKDPDATWFLHASKVLLRNGSTRNPTMTPTRLSLDEIVKILSEA